MTRHVPAQGYWTIDVLRSPVREFNRCYYDGKMLRRRRLDYVDGFYGADDQWQIKADGFRSWARAVLRKTKRGPGWMIGRQSHFEDTQRNQPRETDPRFQIGPGAALGRRSKLTEVRVGR